MPIYPQSGAPIFPQSGGALPPNLSANTNERYVSPDGDDSNVGDQLRPLQYLKTAWEQLYELGGGTIYYADNTDISADGHGLHIDGSGLDPNGVRPMPVTVKQWAAYTRGVFNTKPTARLMGGAYLDSPDQDDPALWISYSTVAMSLQDIHFADGRSKVVRLGWDYFRDQDTGAIVKNDVTAASRATGDGVLDEDGKPYDLTTFTVDPVTFPIKLISRTDDVVRVLLGPSSPFGEIPIRAGAVVHIDYTGDIPNFTSGDYVATNEGAVAGGQGFTVVSEGDDFSHGAVDGPDIGSCASNMGSPYDYITFYGGAAEFPASTYKIISVDADSITVRDYYGYGTRSTPATDTDVGTYAVQNRQSPLLVGLHLRNFAGVAISDVSVDAFTNGPSFDCASIEFYHFEDISILGNNMVSVGGEYGVRDPNRRAAMLFDCGNAGAGTGFGVIERVPTSYGGIRIHNPRRGSAIMQVSHVNVDSPVGSGTFLAVPAVQLIGVDSRIRVLLEDISVVDVGPDTPAVKVNDDAPATAVTVLGTYGDVDGPCTILGSPSIPFVPVTSLNAKGQVGVYGRNRMLAGRHPAAYRTNPLAVLPLFLTSVPPDPDDWTLDNVTATTGKRDPFGGTQGIELASDSGGTVNFYVGNPGADSMDEGDLFMATCWVRGSLSHDGAFILQCRYNPDNIILMQKFAFPDTVDGDEWQLLVAYGRLPASEFFPSVLTGIEMQMQFGAGDDIVVFQPTIGYWTAANAGAAFGDVTDTEIAEILTAATTAPGYLQRNMVGTPVGYKLVGEAGLGTGLAYVEGVAAGQLTVNGSFSPKRYEPIYNSDGTVKGWVELIDADINE